MILGSIQAHNPNGISIGSAVFAGLTAVTDRPTDYATLSVTTGRIYRVTQKIWHNYFVRLNFSKY